MEVAKNRGYSAGGPLPISDHDLLCYFKVNLVPVEEWTQISDIVTRIDSVWLSEHFDAQEAAQASQKT